MTNYIVNIEVLNKLDRMLRRYSIHSKLELFRKLSHVVDCYLPNDKFLYNLFPNRTEQFYKSFSKSCHLHELAYLSLASTAVGEWSGNLKDLNSYEDFRRVINISKSYNPPFIHANDVDTEKNSMLFFVRTGLQQFIYQDSPISGLYRYWYLFNNRNEEFNTREIFKNTFKYDFEDYVIFATGVFILSNVSQHALTEEKIINELNKSPQFNSEKVKHMIRMLSMDRNTAIEKYNEFKSEDERMKIYDYNPYLMKPFLNHDNFLYIPIPLLLFKAITEGFYHYLCYKSIEFRASFGKFAYESYIHHLLKSTSYTVIEEFSYYENKQKFESPDFILVNDNDIVLIEVKANAPSIALRASDSETYKKELYKAYVKAIEQCIKKEKHIRKGILQHPNLPSKIGRVSFLAITLEEYHMIDKEQVKEMIREKNLDLKENYYHIMGTDTLEKVLEKDDRGIFGYLHDREDSGTVYKHIANADINNKGTHKGRSRLLWKKMIDSFASGFRK